MSEPHHSPRTTVLTLLDPALKRACIDRSDVDDELNIIDSGILDSLGFLDLLARLEDRAGVELDLFDADPDVLTTVGGLVTLLTDATVTHSSSRSITHD